MYAAADLALELMMILSIFEKILLICLIAQIEDKGCKKIEGLRLLSKGEKRRNVYIEQLMEWLFLRRR